VRWPGHRLSFNHRDTIVASLILGAQRWRAFENELFDDAGERHSLRADGDVYGPEGALLAFHIVPDADPMRIGPRHCALQTLRVSRGSALECVGPINSTGFRLAKECLVNNLLKGFSMFDEIGHRALTPDGGAATSYREQKRRERDRGCG
jgi:hypothetical protein